MLFVGCLKVILKYAIHLVSLARESTWEERYARVPCPLPSLAPHSYLPFDVGSGAYIYYVEFYMESTILACTLLHFLHVWYMPLHRCVSSSAVDPHLSAPHRRSMYGVSFTLIDLFLFMNMRNVFMNLLKRVSSFKNYRRAMAEINNR